MTDMVSEIHEHISSLAERGEPFVLDVAAALARAQFADRHYVNMTMANGVVHGYIPAGEDKLMHPGFDHVMDEFPCDCPKCSTRAENQDFLLTDWAIDIIREATGVYPVPGVARHWAYCGCEECTAGEAEIWAALSGGDRLAKNGRLIRRRFTVEALGWHLDIRTDGILEYPESEGEVVDGTRKWFGPFAISWWRTRK